MSNEKILRSRDPALLWLIIGIPILFMVGCFMHFAYEWSGNVTVIGIIAPANESIWEHLKMSFWPIMIWWLTGVLILKKRSQLSLNQWFLSCVIAELVCPLVIICFYYTYTGALGIESLILDIFSLFLGVAIAHSAAIKFYKYSKPNRYHLYFSIALLLILAIIYTFFTFTPPHIPLFKDSLTNNYGI